LILCKLFITNLSSIFDELGDLWPSNGEGLCQVQSLPRMQFKSTFFILNR
jgi:hypothetical protein